MVCIRDVVKFEIKMFNSIYFRAQCNEQVKGYSGAQFKKFSSQEEAETYVRHGSRAGSKMMQGSILAISATQMKDEERRNAAKGKLPYRQREEPYLPRDTRSGPYENQKKIQNSYSSTGHRSDPVASTSGFQSGGPGAKGKNLRVYSTR